MKSFSGIFRMDTFVIISHLQVDPKFLKIRCSSYEVFLSVLDLNNVDVPVFQTFEPPFHCLGHFLKILMAKFNSFGVLDGYRALEGVTNVNVSQVI
jgi:hypothetical protein